MSEDTLVLTPGEVADLLKIPEDAVIVELQTGRLKGFSIAGQWRTTQEAFREMISASMNAASLTTATDNHTTIFNKAASNGKEIPTLEQIKSMQWDKVGEFSYQWPLAKNNIEAGAGLEHYTEGYQLLIPFDGQDMSFIIGFCKREAAGMPDRERAVVFKGKNGKTLYPVVEFAGANDYEKSGKMVSVIRAQGRKPIRPGEPVPSDYSDLQIGIYNEIVVGPRAWHCQCVVANKADFAAMLLHTLLRLRKVG